MGAVSSRFWLWRLPALAGSLATLLFASGFWLALSGSGGRPLGEAPPLSQARPLAARAMRQNLLLVLGDSLARGTGDETGRGFAGDVLEDLRKRGRVEIANLAVNGAESSEVRELVETASVRGLAASARWILLSVGGNDLSHALPQARGSDGSPLESVSSARDGYAANLRATLGALRAANPAASIRVLGLYDPFEDRDTRGRLGASVILGWNALLQETALSLPDVVVVPTFDLFERRADRLAVDQFHPNRSGYAAIAARILQTLDGP